MISNNRFRAILVVLLCGCGTAALAGRPLIVDDANVNEPGKGQVETWIAHTSGSTVYSIAPAYAPIEGLEIGALLARERDSSTTASALQAKWLITPSREAGCNVGVVAGLAHVTAGGNTAYLNGLLTCNQPEWGSAHLNLGVSKARNSPKALAWGLAYERQFAVVTPHVEWFGAEGSKPTLQVGLRGNIAKNLQLDGSVGRGNGATTYTLGAKLSF